MKLKKYLNRYLFLLFSLINVAVLLSQTKIEKEMIKLEPKQNLVLVLQELINKVKDCDDYKSSLIWNIGITQAEEGYILDITMQDYINMDYDYVGFFYLGKTLFVVSGTLDDNLFTKLKSEKLEFETKDKAKNQISQTPLTINDYFMDYPTWIYFSTANKLIKMKEYLLPCD
jgi:hypothetical protein